MCDIRWPAVITRKLDPARGWLKVVHVWFKLIFLCLVGGGGVSCSIQINGAQWHSFVGVGPVFGNSLPAQCMNPTFLKFKQPYLDLVSYQCKTYGSQRIGIGHDSFHSYFCRFITRSNLTASYSRPRSFDIWTDQHKRGLWIGEGTERDTRVARLLKCAVGLYRCAVTTYGIRRTRRPDRPRQQHELLYNKVLIIQANSFIDLSGREASEG
jgi:hypothetical protein